MASAHYNPRPENDPGSLDVGLRGPNPSFVVHSGRFYKIAGTDRDLEIVSAPSLDTFTDPSKTVRTVIWKRKDNEPYNHDVWSPRLYALDGRWYIYAGAAHAPVDGVDNNYTHRIVYWVGPPTSQIPSSGGQSGWTFKYALPGMPSHQWAIDPTVFTLEQNRYLVYSGWSLIPHRRDPAMTQAQLVGLGATQRPPFQHLYIVHLAAPDRVDTPDPVMIATPEYPWEFTDHVGVLGTPSYFESPDGSWKGLFVSAGGSWTDELKIATVRFRRPAGERRPDSTRTHDDRRLDPLRPECWHKSPWPVLQTWLTKFAFEQPYVPIQHRRIVRPGGCHGAWGTTAACACAANYPRGPGSPVVVWTNRTDLKPYIGTTGRAGIPDSLVPLDGIAEDISTTTVSRGVGINTRAAVVDDDDDDRTQHLALSDDDGDDEFDILTDVCETEKQIDSDTESEYDNDNSNHNHNRDYNRDDNDDDPDRPTPWLVFHARDGEFAYHTYAQRIFLDNIAEGPHARVWVGTPTTDGAEIVNKSVIAGI